MKNITTNQAVLEGFIEVLAVPIEDDESVSKFLAPMAKGNALHSYFDLVNSNFIYDGTEDDARRIMAEDGVSKEAIDAFLYGIDKGMDWLDLVCGIKESTPSLLDFIDMMDSELQDGATFPSKTYGKMVSNGYSEKSAYGFICGYMNDLDVQPSPQDIQFLESARQDIGDREYNEVTDEASRMMDCLRIAKAELETVMKSLMANGCTELDAMMFIGGYLMAR